VAQRIVTGRLPVIETHAENSEHPQNKKEEQPLKSACA
jgi:hypothetical protein